MTAEIQLTETRVRDLLGRVFAVLADPHAGPDDYAALVTPDYVQYVDGAELDYAGFLRHAEALRRSLKWSRVTFEHVVADGASAATVHRVEAVTSDGERVALKVIAYYRFRGGRLCFVDELTRVLEGSERARDLGSRQTVRDGAQASRTARSEASIRPPQ